ncbi:MAG: hypothetical protein ACP5T2_01825 [Thermoprotei archaeon]
MKRKLMAARADLVERMADLAKRKGATLYSYTNEILEGVLSLEGEKSFQDYVEFNSALELAKTLGLVLAPLSLWSKSENLQDEAENLGTNAAIYIKNKEPDPKKAVDVFLRNLSWNASLFSIRFEEYSARLEIVGRMMTDEQMEFILSVARGALNALGYHEARRSMNTGIAIVHYTNG